jgi:hypothetical protein
MNLWLAIILASIAVYSWKYIGHLIPTRLLNNPKILRVSSMLTIALMAGLVGVQAFVTQGHFHADSRIPAVLAAALLNILKVPFVVMVALAALVAALCRQVLGWP